MNKSAEEILASVNYEPLGDIEVLEYQDRIKAAYANNSLEGIENPAWLKEFFSFLVENRVNRGAIGREAYDQIFKTFQPIEKRNKELAQNLLKATGAEPVTGESQTADEYLATLRGK